MAPVVCALAALILVGCSKDPAGVADDTAGVGESSRALGFDPTELNDAVHPGDDFFAYVNGKWVSENEIPADRSRYGAFDMLRDKSDEDVKAIIEEASASSNVEGSDEQRVGDLYSSFQDFTSRDAVGIQPLAPYLSAIDALNSKQEVFAFFGVGARLGFNSPVGVFAYADAKDPEINTMYLGQGGIGLPEREYYFKDDDKSEALRQQYKALISDAHALAGLTLETEAVDVIYGLETAIAKAHMTKEETRNFANNYTKFDQGDLGSLIPDVAWDQFLGAFGLPEPGYLVSVTTPFFEKLGPILDSVPVADWKLYLRWQVLNSQASRLTRALDDRNFEFYWQSASWQ
jgi:putative endopeptidase